MKKLIKLLNFMSKKEENEFFEFLKSDIDKTVFPVKYQIADMFGNEKDWIPNKTMVFFNEKIYGEFNYFKYKGKIIKSRIDLEEYMIQYIFSNAYEGVESIKSWYDSGFHKSLEVKLKNGEIFEYSNGILDKEIISRLKNCIAFILIRNCN